MLENEVKLLLLRYNILSKEKAMAAHMWECAGGKIWDGDKWVSCINEMLSVNYSSGVR